MSEPLGKRVENELFQLLCLRFGCDCVCHSPTFCKAGGDKELCDILILALPYAIAFQVKWMKLTAEELTGEKAEIKKERMIRRMRSAADQFSEICSVTQTDYDGVLTDEKLEETRLAFTKGVLNTTEWEYVKDICNS